MSENKTAASQFSGLVTKAMCETGLKDLEIVCVDTRVRFSSSL